MTVDIATKTLIGYIHVPQTKEDLWGTMVVMLGDVVLQLMDEILRLRRIRSWKKMKC